LPPIHVAATAGHYDRCSGDQVRANRIARVLSLAESKRLATSQSTEDAHTVHLAGQKCKQGAGGVM
jgi:hypothetical protein